MKGVVLVSALLVAVSFIYAQDVLRAVPVCPPPDPDNGVVLLPNKEDCSTFYACNGLIPVLLPCLNDTWFNPAVGVCDWPANVAPGVCKPPNKTMSSSEEFSSGETFDLF